MNSTNGNPTEVLYKARLMTGFDIGARTLHCKRRREVLTITSSLKNVMDSKFEETIEKIHSLHNHLREKSDVLHS